MSGIRRERETEARIRAMGVSDLVTAFHGYEDRIEALEAKVERLREDNQALAHALRLAIVGKPVRNADELLLRAALEVKDE